jgi:hypothetical protein
LLGGVVAHRRLRRRYILFLASSEILLIPRFADHRGGLGCTTRAPLCLLLYVVCDTARHLGNF